MNIAGNGGFSVPAGSREHESTTLKLPRYRDQNDEAEKVRICSCAVKGPHAQNMVSEHAATGFCLPFLAGLTPPSSVTPALSWFRDCVDG